MYRREEQFQIDLVRWLCALACFIVSGGVIATALFPALKERKAGICLLALLLAAHLGLSCGFMLVFFHAAPNNNNNSVKGGDTTSGIANVTATSGIPPVQDSSSGAELANATRVKPEAPETESVTPKKQPTPGEPAKSTPVEPVDDSKTTRASKAPITASPDEKMKNQTLSPT